jgi:hypothetical protein
VDRAAHEKGTTQTMEIATHAVADPHVLRALSVARSLSPRMSGERIELEGKALKHACASRPSFHAYLHAYRGARSDEWSRTRYVAHVAHARGMTQTKEIASHAVAGRAFGAP